MQLCSSVRKIMKENTWLIITIKTGSHSHVYSPCSKSAALHVNKQNQHVFINP